MKPPKDTPQGQIAAGMLPMALEAAEGPRCDSGSAPPSPPRWLAAASHKAAASRAPAARSARIAALLAEVPEAAHRDVQLRLRQMPATQQTGYLLAVLGRAGPRSAIRSHCRECMGWEGGPAAIAECTAPGCPLFAYRMRKAP